MPGKSLRFKSAARAIERADLEGHLGAQLIREAADTTGEIVGGGTGTLAMRAHAIFSEGLQNIAACASGIDLQRACTADCKALLRPSRQFAGRLFAGKNSRRWQLFRHTTIPG